jgi:hypothetical protein
VIAKQTGDVYAGKSREHGYTWRGVGRGGVTIVPDVRDTSTLQIDGESCNL